ncbi:helix-turn-helix domain-containing protein [Desulfonatronovibrio magnus]|uniref:helix-turn-helix domain-containing protein n=1 Tax=Desulfonatronovibrio magnus TaxID=698827 RepID=UPI0005EB0E08|nr:XRE family transcriptional regulator [Desulfonatronovibrio magnus]RQD55688.1 MAG: XRE family transcriptional regulator [Desulfonatronovibrio sp. MSAO_Bac4]
MPESQPEAYEEIAKRLKGLREAMDLSHDEIAEQLEIDPRKVKEYESGALEIPVGYLYGMAKLCKVDLTVLVSGSEAHLQNYSVVRKGKGMSVDRRKDYNYKSLAYGFSGRRMEPFLIEVPPKEESKMNFNDHPGQEFIYVLSGRLEVRFEDRMEILEPGDSVYFASRTPHALRGLDGETSEMIVVIT